MKDYAAEHSIGTRVRLARRARGYRTPLDLASAMKGANISEAAIENIESGRKADLSISQLLNIAMTLQVPSAYLLAPMGRPSATLDLPNLGDAFTNMTAAEFDSWFASVPDADHRADSAEERNDLAELQALRELQVLRRERRRLTSVGQIAETSPLKIRDRIEYLQEQITTLVEYLRSAGWDVTDEGAD